MKQNVQRFIPFLLLLQVLVLQPALAAPSANARGVKNSKSRLISSKLNEQGVSLAQAGKSVEAERTLREAVEADPGNLTAVLNLASLYLANKKEKVAIAMLDGYIKDGAKDVELYVRLGDAHFGTKNLDLAAKNYETALKLNPDAETVPEKLGTIYTLKDRLHDAERMYLKAVEQTPKNGQLLSNLSSLFLANGKPQKAISTAKRGLQIKATSELYVTLGSAYEELQDYKNSLIAFQRAADLGDTRENLQEKIDEIEEAALRANAIG